MFGDVCFTFQLMAVMFGLVKVESKCLVMSVLHFSEWL